MALKAHKELEMKVHGQFYSNVHMLTLIYPPPREFQIVFKKNMFVKNNKAGFQEVVYYLLRVLDPEKLKQKVSTWPPYNLSVENQFRNEVMKYVNELNSIYKDAGIPQLATSHVISPGGFKFVKFMFKLSQLVLCEYIKRKPEIAPIMLFPLKPSKRQLATNANLEKMKIITSRINRATALTKEDCVNKLDAAIVEAQDIVLETQNTIKQRKENQLVLKKQCDDLAPFNIEHLNLKQQIETKLETLKRIKESYDECQSLSTFLSSKDITLEHDKELKFPPEIAHLIHIENGSLDLSSLLTACNMLTERKQLEVKPMSDQDLEKETERFGKLNHRLMLMSQNLEDIQTEVITLSKKYCKENQENSSISKRSPFQPLQLTESDLNSTNSTVLAVPLASSPSSMEKSGFQFGEYSEDNFSFFSKRNI